MFTSSKVIRGLTPFGKALNLIFPKLSSQNVRGFDQATILSSSFHDLSKKRLTQLPPFVYKIRRKTLGSTSRKVGWGCAAPFLKPLLCFRKKSVSLPYFRPEVLEPGAWPERRRSCYDMYKVGVNIKREMVLSSNDEEVASPKKHAQFTYPISDQKG